MNKSHLGKIPIDKILLGMKKETNKPETLLGFTNPVLTMIEKNTISNLAFSV